MKNQFLRHVAVVASGTAGAQAIVIIFSPVITRIYGPEAFGILGTFSALVAMVLPISALSYPIAIVLPKNDSDAKGIIKLSVYISIALAAVLSVVLLIADNMIMALLQAEAITSFSLLIPLSMLFSAWIYIAQQWLIRKKMFKVTAKIAVVQKLGISSAQVFLGWFHPIAAVLIIVTTIGNAFHSVLLYWGYKSVNKKGSTLHSQIKPKTSLFELAKRYSDFPLYRTPQVLINSISQALPVLMLAAFSGSTAAGFYALCVRVLSIPSQLVGSSVGDVFYPKLTEAAQRKEDLTNLIAKATLTLAIVGLFPFAGIIAFAPWLFGFVFGNEWIIAGDYARWLALMLFFNFINRPVVVAIPVIGLQRGFMIYEFFSTGTKILALYLGFYLFQKDIIAIAIFSIFGAIAYFVLISWVIIFSKHSCYNHNES